MSNDINLTDGTVLEVLNDKVDIDFGNVPSNSVGFARCSTEVTNCITEIPQRIKCTLEDGTLTIKAGSVVIVPYGVEDLTAQYPVGVTFLNDNFKVYDTQFEDGKFFVWAELQDDKEIPTNTTTDTYERAFCLLIDIDGYNLLVNDGSGASAPTGSDTGNMYYNTTTNLVERYNASTLVDTNVRTLPLMKIQANGSIYLGSINQVFNGMGYIGSTVWVDKGIKGLVPNGRNKDGTLNNIEYITSKLEVFSNNTTNAYYIVSIETDGSFGFQQAKNYYYLDTHSLPNVGTSSSKAYIESENFWYACNSGTDYIWERKGQFVIGNATWTNGEITSFNPAQPLRLVDFSQIDGQWVSLNNIRALEWTNITSASPLEIDLSSYIPDDGHDYLVSAHMNFQGTTLNYCTMYGTGTASTGTVSLSLYNQAVNVTASTRGLVYVDTNRKIYIATGATSGSKATCALLGYRRIGTNQ